MRRIYTVALVVLGLAGFGCNGPIGTPADLSRSEINAVMTCQRAVTKHGLDFSYHKLKLVEGCLERVLEVQLLYENGRISPDEYDAKLDDIRDFCDASFEKVGELSTKLVNGITNSCGGGIASLVFSEYNPLGFGGLFFANVTTVDNPSQLAGVVCITKEIFVDFNIALQIPRSEADDVESLYDILGFRPEFYLDDGCNPVPE